MIRRKQLINEVTGEVFETKDDRFTESMNEDGYRFPAHKRGCRMFSDAHYPKGVTWADKGRVGELALYYTVGMSMIGYRQGKEIKAYTIAEIGELIELRRTQAVAFVSRMCKLNVLLKVITHTGLQIYLNPAYGIANGHRLSLELYLMFQDDLSPLLPAWVVSEFLQQARVKHIPVRAVQPRVLSVAEEILKGKA